MLKQLTFWLALIDFRLLFALVLRTRHIDGAISEINSPIATTLRQQYLELARRESEWSVRYGKDHLAVVNLRNRMQEIRNSLFDELRQAAETAKNDYEIAKQRQEDIEKQLADTVAQSRSTSQIQVTLNGLESASGAYRKLYDSFSAAIHGVDATSYVSDYRGARHFNRFPASAKKQAKNDSCSRFKSLWRNWAGHWSWTTARSYGSRLSYCKTA